MNHQAASYLKPKPPKVAFCLPRVTSTQHRRAPLKENQPYHLNWIRNQAVNLVTSNCLMQQMKARLTHQLEPDSTVLAPVTSSFAASEKVWMPLRSQGPDCQHKRHQNKWTLSLFYRSCDCEDFGTWLLVCATLWTCKKPTISWYPVRSFAKSLSSSVTK